MGMKINLGSISKEKDEALQKVVRYYHSFFGDCPILLANVDSGVRRQPIGLEETLLGAKNRAEAVFNYGGADFGVGIESGVYEIDETMFQTTFCSFYNGDRHILGQGPSFVHPKEVRDFVRKGYTVGEAYRSLEELDLPTFGGGRRGIEIISGGNMAREDLMRSAVEMAFFNLKFNFGD
jgi:inosine/xanthosine triphosphatase